MHVALNEPLETSEHKHLQQNLRFDKAIFFSASHNVDGRCAQVVVQLDDHSQKLFEIDFVQVSSSAPTVYVV